MLRRLAPRAGGPSWARLSRARHAPGRALAAALARCRACRTLACPPASAAPPYAAAWGLAAGATALAWALESSRRSRPAGAESDDLSHSLTADEQRTVGLFERCSSSVVHINTFTERQGLVKDAFGYHLNMQEVPQGTGSGFVWDDQHVVTNFHVIKDADRATVVLSDHTSCEATLIGMDADTDLAVLRLVQKGKAKASLTPLERGSSSSLRVGQRVLAIGNPFGLDQTLTSGIVSGLGREMNGVSGRKIRGLIQTDAAINPGNSGGPLLNARGCLIGVNTMIASPSGAFAGVGFAIPVDTVVRVVQQLLRYGHVRHPYLGMMLAPDHVTERISQQLRKNGREAVDGVLVSGIEPGSPAAEAGLMPMTRTPNGMALGDEVVAIGGTKVSGTEGMLFAIEECGIGQEVDLTYRRRTDSREGSLRHAVVRLAERPNRYGVRPVSHGAGSGGILVAEPEEAASRLRP